MEAEKLLKYIMLNPFPDFKKVGVWSFCAVFGSMPEIESLYVFFDEYTRVIKVFIDEFQSTRAEIKISKLSSWSEYRFDGMSIKGNKTPLNNDDINSIQQYLKEVIITNKDNFFRKELVVYCSVSGLVRIGTEIIEPENLFEIVLTIDEYIPNAVVPFQLDLKITVNNLAFLPNNPLLQEKHYDLWTQNAPYLARCIKKIQESALFTLDNTDWNEKHYGYPYGQNPLFLQNSFKTQFWKDWDETYVPLELIKTLER